MTRSAFTRVIASPWPGSLLQASLLDELTNLAFLNGQRTVNPTIIAGSHTSTFEKIRNFEPAMPL